MAAWPPSEPMLPSTGYGTVLSRTVEPIRSFSITPVGSTPWQSELLCDEAAIPLLIDGILLQAQYRVGSRYLILLTEDCPYEEALHVYLLNHAHQVLDALELGLPYTPGIVKNLAPQGDTLTFSFFGEDHWRLDVLGAATCNLALPWGRPVTHKSGFFKPRWMRLKQVR